MQLNSQKHYPTSFKVIINYHSISPEDNLKYPDVLLNNQLSWKPHVQKVKTRAVESESRSRSRKDFQPEESESESQKKSESESQKIRLRADLLLTNCDCLYHKHA